jgi:YVTN family beta-propeller protein
MRSIRRTPLRSSLVLVLLAAAVPPEAPCAALVEEIYVLNTLGADVTRVVPSTGVTTPAFLAGGASPNEIDIVGRTAYITSSLSNELIRASLDAPAASVAIPLAPEMNPWSVEVRGDRAYVSNFVSSTVSIVDLAGAQAIGALSVGKSPEGLLLYGDRLYVACSGFDFSTFGYDPGRVFVIDLAAGAVVDTIPTGLNPQAMARDAIGRIHVVCTGDYVLVPAQVDVIDPAAGAVVQTIAIGGAPGTIAIGGDGLGYLGSYVDGLLVYDAASGAPLRSAANPVDVGGLGAGGVLPAGGGGAWVAVSGGANLLVEIGPAASGFAIESAYAVGSGPLSIARSRRASPAPEALLAALGPPRRAAVDLVPLAPAAPGRLRVRLRAPAGAGAALALFDVSGRRVAERRLTELGAEGAAEAEWDLGSERVATGRYVLRLSAGGASVARSVLFVR